MSTFFFKYNGKNKLHIDSGKELEDKAVMYFLYILSIFEMQISALNR